IVAPRSESWAALMETLLDEPPLTRVASGHVVGWSIGPRPSSVGPQSLVRWTRPGGCMRQRSMTFVASALLVLATSAGAFAQGASTAASSGVVGDSDQQVIPGATVVVKNNATGETFNTVSSERG